jgi:FAD/FMN-containing dehydrogenase
VVERYAKELPEAEPLSGDEETDLWTRVREFTPGFLAGRPEAAVVRVSTTIAEIADVMKEAPAAAFARAGSGVVYLYFDDCSSAGGWTQGAVAAGLRPVIEFVGESGCTENRWPMPGSDFAMMQKIKQMFDPKGLLNPGRLYGRL